MSKDLIFQLINFLILAIGLGWFLKSALSKMFKNERADWEQKIKDAREQYEKVKGELDEAEGLLKNVDRRIAEMKEISAKELKFERERLLEDATGFSEKLVKDCELRIKNETERAKTLLQKEVWEASMASARSKIRQDLKAKDQSWTQDFLEPEHRRPARVAGEK